VKAEPANLRHCFKELSLSPLVQLDGFRTVCTLQHAREPQLHSCQRTALDCISGVVRHSFMPNKVTDTYQKFSLSCVTALFCPGFQKLGPVDDTKNSVFHSRQI